MQKRQYSMQCDLVTRTKLSLPANFSDEILNLELMMEETPVHYDAIQKLSDYYTVINI